MSTLKLRFLGPPSIEIDDEPVTFSRRKSLALLAYLGVTGVAQQRDTLATLLWPDSAQGHARGLLRRELSSLRSALGGSWITVAGDQVSLPPHENIWLDVQAFADLLNKTHDAQHDLDDLATAADLYRGDLLTGFTLGDCPEFDDWQFFQAEEYRRLLLHALDQLVDGYSRPGEWDTAIAYARRRLTLDPLHEPAQRSLMRLYAHNGQTAAALHQYEECVQVLHLELGAPPEPETTALHEAIRARRFPSPAPAARTVDRLVALPSNNLPPQSTSFVGRTEDIAAILERLTTPECRLLTIVGGGGAGKTRLALAVAEQMTDQFDGVYFVPLIGVDDARFLATAIADAVGLRTPARDMSRRDQLLAFLGQEALLLVLDGFEHLSDAAGFLPEMLAAAPHVKILVTSRQALALNEEWRYPLHGLPYPDADARTDDVFYPALELFRQRARQIEPDFALTSDSETVATICRRLDGMPLGIELAAALVRVLSPTEINAELTNNIDILSTTARNVPEQHRSLRAAFERSWQLLTGEEQAALCALSIFRDHFDREAAEAVAGITLAQLAALVDRSFVRRLPSHRYDLHELMRQFIAEKMAATPGAVETGGRRHCHHFCGRLARMSWVFEPGKEPDGFHLSVLTQRVGADIDNYRAAWLWAIAHVDVTALRQAMNVLAEYATVNMPEEGRHLFGAAIEAVQADADLAVAESEALIASLILRRSWCWQWNHLTETVQDLTRSLAMLRRSAPENYVDIAANLVWLGITVASTGDNDKGEALINEGISLFRRHDHRAGTAWGLHFGGLLEAGRGHLLRARDLLEQSLTLFEVCKNWKWRSTARENLADVALLQGDFRGAKRLYEESLAEAGNEDRPELMRFLGESCAALGEFEQAEACFAQAEARFTQIGMPFGMALAYAVTPGVLAWMRGNLAEAEPLLVGSLATARLVGFEQRLATNLHNLARLRHDQGRYDEAISLLHEALAISRRIGFRFATGLVLCQFGHTATALDLPEAPAYYAEALQIALENEIDRVSTDVLRGVARRLANHGRLEDAVSLLALAVDHPASDWETRQKAQTLLSELAAELPPERFTFAVEQGHSGDLHSVAAELLRNELLQCIS
ncbi:MAG: BTAD domain-containing putative transcriptional regulator [Caldilineaceae bacterium]